MSRAATQTTPPALAAALPSPTGPTQVELARTQLEALPVKGRAAKTGYSRTQFGQAWTDDVTVAGGHNGCDTRNDILRRDLTGATMKPGSHGCAVAAGTLADPYTGRTIGFTRGETTSTAVQIDHVVALSNAWQTGAQQLTMAQRTDLANDPINLQATDGPTNQQKGDGDAATWLPPNKSYRCTYVARQIAVKSSYRLWVTAAEKDAMTRVLATCTNTPAPPAPSTPDTAAPTSSTASSTASSTTVPPPAVTATPADPTTPDPTTADPTTPDPITADPTSAAATTPAADAGTGNSSYYRNCTAAKAAGAAPLYRGQPGYRPGLDRDSDGIACEK